MHAAIHLYKPTESTEPKVDSKTVVTMICSMYTVAQGVDNTASVSEGEGTPVICL